jgi:Protein of unknown function (DUF1524)
MTIEHLLAQNPADGQAIPNAGSIGNLILVPPKLNKSLGNKSFEKKMADLRKAKVPLDKALTTATSWGKSEIAARIVKVDRKIA